MIPNEVFAALGGASGAFIISKVIDFLKFYTTRNSRDRNGDLKPGHGDICKGRAVDLMEIKKTLKEHDRDISVVKTNLQALPEMRKDIGSIFRILRENK